MNPVRQALITESAKYGFTLDYSDLRCGLFFLKRDSEVRSIGWLGRITPTMIPYYVKRTVEDGRRIDQIKGSSYYTPT
jgi:hypothetical protein